MGNYQDEVRLLKPEALLRQYEDTCYQHGFAASLGSRDKIQSLQDRKATLRAEILRRLTDGTQARLAWNDAMLNAAKLNELLDEGPTDGQ